MLRFHCPLCLSKPTAGIVSVLLSVCTGVQLWQVACLLSVGSGFGSWAAMTLALISGEGNNMNSHLR